MLNEILLNPMSRSAIYVAVAVLALALALVVSSVVRLNKGAGVNGPLVLVALGLVLDAVGFAMLSLGYYGQETLGAWAPIVLALSQLVKLSGLAWWRAIIKRLAS